MAAEEIAIEKEEFKKTLVSSIIMGISSTKSKKAGKEVSAWLDKETT